MMLPYEPPTPAAVYDPPVSAALSGPGLPLPPPPPHHHHHHHPVHHPKTALPRYVFKMPRVVAEQKSKYDSDELFRRHSRESEVRFLLSIFLHFFPLYTMKQIFFLTKNKITCTNSYIEEASQMKKISIYLVWNFVLLWEIYVIRFHLFTLFCKFLLADLKKYI